MIDIPYKHETEWNYLGWKELEGSQRNFQKDWNQTILTKINMMSAYIFRESMRGGANAIRGNSKMLSLIQTLEYYDPKKNMLGYKYNLEIDDLISEDILYVYRDSIKKRDILIPLIKFQEEEISIDILDNNQFEELGEVYFKVSQNDEKIIEFKKSLVSKINILNYGKED